MLHNKIKLLSIIFSAFAVVTLSAMKREAANDLTETSPLKKNNTATYQNFITPTQNNDGQPEIVQYHFLPVRLLNDLQKQKTILSKQTLQSYQTNNQKK